MGEVIYTRSGVPIEVKDNDDERGKNNQKEDFPLGSNEDPFTGPITPYPSSSRPRETPSRKPLIPGKPTPDHYNLPHEEFRPHQLETIQWIENNGGVMVCEQPTGSGKSAVAVSQSVSRRTVTLVRTKYLQEQYSSIYGAHILMGKGNYQCIHPDNNRDEVTRYCDECLYDANMYICPFVHDCHYMIAKKKAQILPLVSTNYAYWLSTKSIHENVGLLVCDEGHLLSDITLDWAGMTISAPVRRKWGLPEFPSVSSSIGFLPMINGWLEKSIPILVRKSEELLSGRGDEDRKQGKRAKSVLMKLMATHKAVNECSQDWYVRSGPGVCYYRGGPVPGLIVRPLTARYHWPNLFIKDWDLLLMSATIGNEETFCEELGITDYKVRRVPNQYKPSERPIFLLDVPKMSYKSKKGDYDHQADAIARAIKSVPDDWSGFVHVTRKSEGKLMADRLAKRGLGGRVWTPPQQDRYGRYLGTGEQSILWDKRRDNYPGSICVSWQFWEGMDGLDEKINIIAKVPFPSLGDPYEKARMRYSTRMYLQRTAWTIMQACGRTRRGRPQDYDIHGEVNGLVAIADGNWARIKSYISPDFLDAMVEI